MFVAFFFLHYVLIDICEFGREFTRLTSGCLIFVFRIHWLALFLYRFTLFVLLVAIIISISSLENRNANAFWFQGMIKEIIYVIQAAITFDFRWPVLPNCHTTHNFLLRYSSTGEFSLRSLPRLVGCVVARCFNYCLDGERLCVLGCNFGENNIINVHGHCVHCLMTCEPALNNRTIRHTHTHRTENNIWVEVFLVLPVIIIVMALCALPFRFCSISPALAHCAGFSMRMREKEPVKTLKCTLENKHQRQAQIVGAFFSRKKEGKKILTLLSCV